MVKNKKNLGLFSSKLKSSTKSNTLKFLYDKITESKIENLYDFTVEDWKKNQSRILSDIQINYKKNKIIIRSSAVGEDSNEESQAGNYLSIQNIDVKSKIQLIKNIEKVISSYSKKNNSNSQNQILIQTFSKNIIVSGVVFSKTPDIGSPYYVINYEEGVSTDGVTHGRIGNTVKIFKKLKKSKTPTKWQKLLNSINELETLLDSDQLDIEFGINNKKNIIIFQVRPITSIKHSESKKPIKKIEKLISKNQNQFTKLNQLSKVLGSFTIFSDMTDWNPAEIIGSNPNHLDYSLYDYLIMKKVWNQGRNSIGYKNVKTDSLMKKFGNKPYVDVRASFNSLIPNSIPKKLERKLMSFYLQKLFENPHLHDKVEFEILFTCYDLTLEKRLQELKKYKFTKNDIETLKNNLKRLTNNIINTFPEICIETKKSIQLMKQTFIEINQQLDSKSKNHTNMLVAAEQLLKNCKKFGTVKFSTIARIAFIATILMKSLEKEGYIENKTIENFMNSIITPVSELQSDFNQYISNELSKKQLLKKYGHLRSGTYDITASRYDQTEKFLDKIKYVKRHTTKLKNSKLQTPKILEKHGLNFDKISFWDFVEQSLVQREKLKFEFTKNLSDALELIAKSGTYLGFSRDDISHLDIRTLIKHKNKPKSILKQILGKEIIRNSQKKSLNNSLVLPPLIFSKKDFEIIQYMITKPNYITTKFITGDVLILDNLQTKIPLLSNKIIIIENADPGYDWIFTKNPLGLITKYGGVASHMAIRCAELGLPAAIGCGELLYEKLLKTKKILLDCKNEQIILLESENPDEFLEEKRILKSLGYIK
jgi:phosphoenolpyruvate synthase/pyruvate phosphate dikinase